MTLLAGQHSVALADGFYPRIRRIAYILQSFLRYSAISEAEALFRRCSGEFARARPCWASVYVICNSIIDFITTANVDYVPVLGLLQGRRDSADGY